MSNQTLMCNRCGQINPIERNTCFKCGGPLPNMHKLGLTAQPNRIKQIALIVTMMCIIAVMGVFLWSYQSKHGKTVSGQNSIAIRGSSVSGNSQTQSVDQYYNVGIEDLLKKYEACAIKINDIRQQSSELDKQLKRAQSLGANDEVTELMKALAPYKEEIKNEQSLILDLYVRLKTYCDQDNNKEYVASVWRRCDVISRQYNLQ